MKLNAVLFDLSLLFSEHFNKFNFLSTYIRHLDGSLPRRAPPNLQVNLNLLRERSDAFPTLFLLVRLPCDVYFVQVDHICSMDSHHELFSQLLCSQCLSGVLTLLVSFKKCSFNSIAHYSLTNKTHSHQRLKY